MLGFALGAEAGARVSSALRMPMSASSFLRIIRRAPLPPTATPRVLGVDDFALRRGRVYATILVDLEHRRPVDLLPDRTAETFASWLRKHPGVDVIARDRSTEYTRGATEGAPTATQVADRWHLLQNLREAVERVLNHHHTRLRQLPPHAMHTLPAPSPRPQRFRPLTASEQARQDVSRTIRRARYDTVRQLVAAGVSQREIARHLHMSRTTVRLFAAADTFPERAPARRAASQLDPFLPYLHRRWREGTVTGSQLWREMRAPGYPGAQRHVLRWVQHQRIVPAPTGPRTTSMVEATTAGTSPALPAPRQLVWVFLRAPADLTEDEHAILARVQQDPQMVHVYRLAQQFQQMVRTRQVQVLTDWFEQCTHSGINELQTFAASLRRDEAAIRHALTEPWSTGPVEGQITRVKCVKRQMYGRAGFDLLRRRVLRAA
jgi:transposase